MNCRSCRAKLSARDQRCPSCGRRNAGSQDLGAGSSGDADRDPQPLPPAKAWDDSPDDSRSGDASRASARPPEAEEPTLRLTELVKTPLEKHPLEKNPLEKTQLEKTQLEKGNGAPRGRTSTPAHSTPSHTPLSTSSSSAPGRGEVRALLAESPQLLEPGLRIHTEAGDGGKGGEPSGVGYETPVGEIDLLARDSGGAFVVVLIPGPGREKELVGELLQLMGWVRKHLCDPGQEVRAIALLDSPPEDLGYAALAVADTVEFKRYKLALTFESLEV